MPQSPSPYCLLCEFASLLGWRGLCIDQSRLTPENCGELPPGTIITSYSTRDLKFFLQIHENPIGQSVHYHASIVPERYAIRPIGWHPFSLTDLASVTQEANRLTPILSRRLFRNRKWRQRFMRDNPHLVWPSRMGRRAYRRFMDRVQQNAKKIDGK